jgi:hypothetical protein
MKIIITNGLAHISMILRYLSEKKILIACPRTTRDKNKDYLADLILQEQKFGVSIFIPITLVENEKILKSTNWGDLGFRCHNIVLDLVFHLGSYFPLEGIRCSFHI